MIDLTRLSFFIKKDYDEIDVRVEALVDAINATGVIQTVASCQGHGMPWRSPYVYFKTTVEVAATIERKLQEQHFNGRLNDFWTLRGIFNEQYQLCFALQAPRYDESARSIVQSFFSCSRWFRHKLDADLKTLSCLFQEAMLELRQSNKPKISSTSDEYC